MSRNPRVSSGRSPRVAPLFGLVCLVLLGGPSALTADPAAKKRAREVSFNRDIRPLLSSNCFHCHGPDQHNRKAKLRLDDASGVARVFKPGDRAASDAWARITASDPDDRMPPPDSGHELKPEEIELIGRWIDRGAKWEGHWAFAAPVEPELPEVSRVDWPKAPVDSFILAELEAEGLAPNPEADRETLLRRVTLDLTGLPPTIAEIDAFLADDSPGAYERAVDRLLASPAYGERMTLAWMDAARYGDSSVFHADGPRDMWPWRDWVIDAYNANKPFDEFTIEQLAGDLLPEPSTEQLIATGFHRNNATTDEGGVIPEEFRVEYAVDRVKTTALVWMALTMECAQCHDHKYEPISRRDYYRFYAYFNQASDPGMQTRNGNQAPTANVPNYALLPRVPRLNDELAQLKTQLTARVEEAEPRFATWVEREEKNPERSQPEPKGIFIHFPFDDGKGKKIADVIEPERIAALRGKPTWEKDGRLGGALRLGGNRFVDAGDLANFERNQSFSYGAWVKTDGDGAAAVIARMKDGNAYRGYDLYLAGGHVSAHVIHRWPENAIKVTSKAKIKKGEWHHVFATYDGSSRATGLKIYIDGKPQEVNVEQNGLSETIQAETPLYVGRRNPGSQFSGLVDDVRIYDVELTPKEVATLAGADPIGPILATKREERTPEQTEILRRHFLTENDAAYVEVREAIARVESEIASATKPVSTVMIMKDVDKMRTTFMLDRGNYASPQKDKPVDPGTPEFLPALPEGAPANRLGLARWIVDPRHPLTARVAVNRYWYMLFGTGIVETVEDFGQQGAQPSHQDLLDWLAVDFVRSGWNVKRMIKQLVLSATYRQSTRTSPDLLERDPKNRLLARGPRFRLQGEFIRDNALAASGLLVRRIGGPGVKPYQPPGLWNEVSLSAGVRFVQDHGEKLFRRSMYTYWKRSAPAPGLTIFDAPTREQCALRRSRTNTPLQALVTLNDPQFVEAARKLAERVLLTPGSTEARITYAYRLATGVRPRADILAILTSAYAEELGVFRTDGERAKALLAIGESPRAEKLDAAEHAAMTVVTSMILNLDATITRG